MDHNLLSVCYQKLASWQYEYLESSRKQELDAKEHEYMTIVDNCAKATTIDPQNSAAWQIYSTTNDAFAYFYSKKFAKQFRG